MHSSAEKITEYIEQSVETKVDTLVTKAALAEAKLELVKEVASAKTTMMWALIGLIVPLYAIVVGLFLNLASRISAIEETLKTLTHK